MGEADDGIEPLEFLKQYLSDLAIMDISMPRIGGLEATKEIKELYPQVKVLILTLHREQDYVQRQS